MIAAKNVRTISTDKWTIRFKRYISRNWVFYLLILPGFLDVLIFRYFPLYGIQIAFRDYKAVKGIFGSKWIGLKYFLQFIETPVFWQLMRNTLTLSLSCLVFGFPLPIILALLLNEQRNLRLKKITQMITYMPHFVSTVAVIGIVNFMVDRENGIINIIRGFFGLKGINYLAVSAAFRPLYTISEIWQHMGWSAILYLAALSSVDTEILEAARIDGANRFQVIWYINIPTILPAVIIMLILNCGSLLSIGFEKVYLMQNDNTLDVTEIISTYVYKCGVIGGQFSYTTAIGIFNNVVNCVILLFVNTIADKLSGSSLF